MTIPYYIEEPVTHKEVLVPNEIIYYCDRYTVDTDREELRYLDCVYMNMGYYGNHPSHLKQMRERLYNRVQSIFD